LDQDNVSSLFTLGALGDFKLYVLTFLKGFISVAFDRAVMDEYILTALGRDKTITLLIAEPFHFALYHLLLFTPFPPVRGYKKTAEQILLFSLYGQLNCLVVINLIKFSKSKEL